MATLRLFQDAENVKQNLYDTSVAWAEEVTGVLSPSQYPPAHAVIGCPKQEDLNPSRSWWVDGVESEQSFQ